MSRKIVRNVIAVLCGAVLSMGGASKTCAQSAAPAVQHAPYAAAKENAERQAKEWLSRGIPGFSVAVAIGGKVVYAEGFGNADLQERVPAWSSTKFRIGSVSKPLTSAGMMLLVEQGKLDLDAPIQRYVPSFPDKGAPITARMLAIHLGGIRQYKEGEPDSQKHYDTVVGGLERFQNDPLVAPPGTKFSYSSYGYNLLSAAIESAAGEHFLEYEQEHVFHSPGPAFDGCGSACGDHRTTGELLFSEQRQTGAERGLRGQQLQMGRRRFSLDF